MPRGGKITDLREKTIGRPGVEQALATWQLNRSTTGVDWKQVSATNMRAALASCMGEGVYIAFSPVQGGLGVCLTLYAGEVKKKLYANNHGDVNELLEQIIELVGGTAGDFRQAYAGGSD